MKFKTVTEKNIDKICSDLAAIDPHLSHVYELYGRPPLWHREPGFATLLQIILEQQVSLASAKACFDKLTARLGNVAPETLLTLDDIEMRQVGFSRQKMAYARHLSEAILDRRIDLYGLWQKSDQEIKNELMKLKGVGAWTSDIYLLMALLRPDVMPKGDIALHSSWHNLSGEARPTSEEFVRMAEKWKPFRSVAARLLWHYYLSQKRKC